MNKKPPHPILPILPKWFNHHIHYHQYIHPNRTSHHHYHHHVIVHQSPHLSLYIISTHQAHYNSKKEKKVF